MPILNPRVFDELDQERIICITGALSGGKSRLAFDLALYYWRKGFRVISNVPHNFDTDFITEKRQQQQHLENDFIILDEGGEYVREAKLASMITRSAGKANYYVIFSGKRLPHKNLQDIIIRPRFDFYQNFGIPLVLWKGTVNASERYNFPIWQFNPKKLHGTYSTLSSSGAITEIIARASLTVDILAAREGQVAGVQAEAGFQGMAEDIASGIEAFSA